MDNVKKISLAYYMIVSAIVWAATFIGCAIILKEAFKDISMLMYSAMSIQLIIWSALAVQDKKQKKCGKELNSDIVTL